MSQHLARLRRAGLVEPHRKGRRVYYRLNSSGESLLDLLGEALDGTPATLHPTKVDLGVDLSQEGVSEYADNRRSLVDEPGMGS